MHHLFVCIELVHPQDYRVLQQLFLHQVHQQSYIHHLILVQQNQIVLNYDRLHCKCPELQQLLSCVGGPAGSEDTVIVLLMAYALPPSTIFTDSIVFPTETFSP